MSDPYMIKTTDLTKRYGRTTAVDGVALEVREGDRYGLLGPNGSGKTTLVRMLLGLVFATRGEIEVLGRPVPRRVREVLPSIGALVEGPGAYPNLSGRTNLALFDAAGPGGLRRDRQARIDLALERVGLAGIDRRPVRAYSLGMRQRLGLAAALLTRPRLLVLDEPANGLDPAGKRDVHSVISGLADHGTAVLLSSHQMDDLASLCAEVSILATGRVVFSGSVDKLAAESGDLDHRLRTSDPARAQAIATDTPEVRVGGSTGSRLSRDTLVVRGPVSALDALVARLAAEGVAIRELAPVVSPLEAAFLALTEGEAR